MSSDGRVLIFTGDGKGKTTAAMGAVLRAVGHGWRVLIVQFIKSNQNTGELAAYSHLPKVEMVQMGCGFIPKGNDPRLARHKEMARHAFDYAKKAVESGKFELIVLDEICVAVRTKLIDSDDVIRLIANRPAPQSLILTGRGVTSDLMELADTVTEMRCVKHALQAGIPAREGVEF